MKAPSRVQHWSLLWAVAALLAATLNPMVRVQTVPRLPGSAPTGSPALRPTARVRAFSPEGHGPEVTAANASVLGRAKPRTRGGRASRTLPPPGPSDSPRTWAQGPNGQQSPPLRC
jgi:hypothetical protein